MTLLRKIILGTQYALALTVLVMGIMLWTGSMDFKNVASFLALLSLLTGLMIYTTCTSYEIIAMKSFFRALGTAGLLCGIGSAMVFWQYFAVHIWYYFNFVLVIGICFSLFAETEKTTAKKERSVIHVVASIIILITFFFLLLHILGFIDMQLPLLILVGAVVILLVMVVMKNRKREKKEILN